MKELTAQEKISKATAMRKELYAKAEEYLDFVWSHDFTETIIAAREKHPDHRKPNEVEEIIGFHEEMVDFSHKLCRFAYDCEN